MANWSSKDIPDYVIPDVIIRCKSQVALAFMADISLPCFMLG